MRKIVYITGTRAEYGLMKSTLKAIHNHPKLCLELIVTGTHLMRRYGNTIKEIQKDGFKIHKVKIPDVDDRLSMAQSFGEAVSIFSKALNKLKPDILLIEADRYESLAGAIAGAFLNIYIAHVSGGDVSGSIDESIRHSITKFSHIHFPGTKKSSQRIRKMGENPKNVFMVGTPGIESVSSIPEDIARRLHLDLNQPILLILQHPVPTEKGDPAKQMRETLVAISKIKRQTIIIYPNTDPGSKEMIKEIQRFKKLDYVQIHKNIPRELFLGLMNISSVMIGNSSSGITEAPMFNLPVINIGTRQQGRERGGNIHDVDYDSHQIASKITELLSTKRKSRGSPYSGEKTPQKIAEILASIKLTKNLLNKRLTY